MQDAGGGEAFVVDSPHAARELFFPKFENARTERLYVAHLAADGLLIGFRVRDAALDKQIDFPMRSIIADALSLGSAALILAHNHPSGDPTPSHADIQATRGLILASRSLGFTVRDHLVFAGETFVSFRERGLL
jgi:DNA repair protein RadC